MTKHKELLARCRREGFVLYSDIDARQLQELLERGYHRIYPRKRWWMLKIHSSRGLKLEEFDYTVYRVERCPYTNDGYKIRGLDLEGRFDSHFIPDRYIMKPVNTSRIGQTVKRRLFSSAPTITRLAADDDDEGAEGAGEQLFERVPVYGGWYVPSSRRDECLEFCKSVQKVQPLRSLQELAANVMLSRKLCYQIPKGLVSTIARLKIEILHT